ncbi:hypothetical protein N780_10260 [Pontibacillus chungwhensis BH030062]|uniref:Uncharacterized protein n=1 Tax=Pontibacillus chungwhensis BH030062 TaxID=1385513 RepID=A0A0A2UMZ6_9BACI|nr:hypothetical protein [Pontibacillus chungwhensis]KGP89667.1 hypothetical protein N780_10260 [Pontibacillus chungwhensis BH030062]
MYDSKLYRKDFLDLIQSLLDEAKDLGYRIDDFKYKERSYREEANFITKAFLRNTDIEDLHTKDVDISPEFFEKLESENAPLVGQWLFLRDDLLVQKPHYYNFIVGAYNDIFINDWSEESFNPHNSNDPSDPLVDGLASEWFINEVQEELSNVNDWEVVEYEKDFREIEGHAIYNICFYKSLPCEALNTKELNRENMKSFMTNSSNRLMQWLYVRDGYKAYDYRGTSDEEIILIGKLGEVKYLREKTLA